MTEAPPVEEDRAASTAADRGNKLAIAAFGCGLVALVFAAIVPELIPPAQESVRDELIGLFKSVVSGKDNPALETYRARLRVVRALAMAIGLLGFVIAVLGWMRKQSRPLLISAAGMCVVALLWTHIVAAIVIVIIFALIAGILP